MSDLLYILFLPRPGRREINRTKHKEYLIVNCPYVYTVVEPISYFRLKVRRSRKGGVSLFFRNSEPILLVYIQDGARLDVLRGQPYSILSSLKLQEN